MVFGGRIYLSFFQFMEEVEMTVAGTNDYAYLRLNKNAVQGLNLAYATTLTATVSVGNCRDSEDQNNIEISSAKTLNFALSGLNGLDTGAIGASKLYYVYAIADSLGGNPSGVIASLSSTPLLPNGAVVNRPYDQYRRIGWLRSSAGSVLLPFYQSGAGNVRQYAYDTMIVALTSGTAQTLTAIDVSASCPPLDNMKVNFFVEFTPATAGDTVKFAPFGSTATVIPGISGAVAAVKQSMQVPVLAKLDTATPKVLYINSAASCDSDIWVQGFEDVI